MKIETLVKDIEARLTSSEPYPEDAAKELAESLTKTVVAKLTEKRAAPTLRMSNLGWPDRKLWYAINRPELAEKLGAATRMKFLLGDIVEVVVLWLAKMAGHSVTHEQGKVSVHGVSGSVDALVDGELVDVKSASPASFKKFSKHGLSQDDPFGYRSQLGGYLSGVPSLDTAARRDRAHFLANEKVLGKLALDTHSKEELGSVTEETIAQKRAMLAWPTPPARCYPDVPDGASGNRKLGTGCSYCPFKQSCWTGLRAFKYSKGPVFLTEVKRTPDVPELSLREAAAD
jgi:hypothetical protein